MGEFPREGASALVAQLFHTTWGVPNYEQVRAHGWICVPSHSLEQEDMLGPGRWFGGCELDSFSVFNPVGWLRSWLGKAGPPSWLWSTDHGEVFARTFQEFVTDPDLSFVFVEAESGISYLCTTAQQVERMAGAPTKSLVATFLEEEREYEWDASGHARAICDRLKADGLA